MSTDTPAPPSSPSSRQQRFELRPLPPFKPDLYERAWQSTPHPTLPLLATAHGKAVTVFSLSTFSAHSSLTGGHERSVRSAAWRPGLPPHKLCLVTGSFDSTAGLWRWQQDVPFEGDEVDVAAEFKKSRSRARGGADNDDAEDNQSSDEDGWEFTLVLEGHENEIKSAAFSPSGAYLATCSRDKSVWVWEDVGASEEDDEWETVAVLNEHDGDVKCVVWCPDVPGRRAGAGAGRRYGLDVLASASYDNTVRVWREDGDGEWVCVAVLEGHEGTVWGLQWEPDPRRARFPRLMTWSADQTIRIWTLREEEEEEQGDGSGEGGHAHAHSARGAAGGGLGAIPNTMRRSLREDWDCTAILPKAHTRDIYSATWSAASGLVASTGSDGVIAIYAEDVPAKEAADGEAEAEAAAELDGDVAMTNGHNHNHRHHHDSPAQGSGPAESSRWRVVTTMPSAHGPYEVNHITWCRRFDAGSERRGVEEMLVTTGDDGVVRPWQVVS